jgi:hypothetical protein
VQYLDEVLGGHGRLAILLRSTSDLPLPATRGQGMGRSLPEATGQKYPMCQAGGSKRAQQAVTIAR